MAKISKKRVIELTKFVRQQLMEGKTRRQIRDEVKKEFNIDYCISAMRYYELRAMQPENLERIKKNEDTMNRWRKEYADDNKLTEEELYAEMLYGLASKKVDPNDFDSNMLAK